jgi:hypothetical protein
MCAHGFYLGAVKESALLATNRVRLGLDRHKLGN